MYSWEITKTMSSYDYNLPSNVYLDITDHSPQIDHVMYNAWDNSLEMWDKEGNHWGFTVYYAAA